MAKKKTENITRNKTNDKGLKDRVIFGLDISLNASGWAVVKLTDGVMTILDTGEIKNPTYMTHGEKLVAIRRTLNSVYAKYSPSDVAREAGFSRFTASTQALYKAYGVTEELFAGLGVDIPAYTATTIKKEVGGHGKATKEDVEGGVRNLLGLDDTYTFNSDNESDAVAVAITHCKKKGYL